jgi:hypothetical protein
MGWIIHGLNPNRDNKFFYSPKCPEQLWGPPSPLFNGYRGSFLGIKQLGCAGDHLPPTSAEVKNEWSYNSAPICLHNMDGDNSAFHPIIIINYSEWLQI